MAPPHLSITRSLQDVYTHSRILGVPWHPTKWYDFADVFTYLGLLWDLTNRTVDLPDQKRRKYLHKITDLLAVSKGYHRVSCKDAMSIDSTFSHVAFIIPHGRAYLSNLSTFISEYPSRHAVRSPLPRSFWT
jgi:hypothetical protein